MTGGGYYFAVSDLMDLKLTADIFTKGSWAANMETNYNKRYKYSGSLQAGYQVTKLGDKGMPDYSVAQDCVESPARPEGESQQHFLGKCKLRYQ